MILLSFSSAFKYVLGLMLAILGYIPFEHSEKPVASQIEKIIVIDTIQSQQYYIYHSDSIINLNNNEIDIIFLPSELLINPE